MSSFLNSAIDDNTLGQLADRVKGLRKMALDDLPLAELQRWLEQRWRPDGSMFLPATLSRETLVHRVDGGAGTVNFSASSGSAASQIAHRLGVVPVAVVVTTKDAPSNDTILRYNTSAYTASTFTVAGIAASSFTGSVGFTWVAYGEATT